MKIIVDIQNKKYEVNGTPSSHHQSGWNFPTEGTRVKDFISGKVIDNDTEKKNILKQISNEQISRHFKSK